MAKRKHRSSLSNILRYLNNPDTFGTRVCIVHLTQKDTSINQHSYTPTFYTFLINVHLFKGKHSKACSHTGNRTEEVWCHGYQLVDSKLLLWFPFLEQNVHCGWKPDTVNIHFHTIKVAYLTNDNTDLRVCVCVFNSNFKTIEKIFT